MDDQLIADLKATREQLASRGRCKGNLMDGYTGSVCLDGAVGMATVEGYEQLAEQTAEFYDDDHPAYAALVNDSRAQAVLTAIADQVKDHEVEYLSHPITLHEHILDTSIYAERDPAYYAMEMVFHYNDMKTVSDEDCFSAIDKAIVEAGGMA